MTEPLPAQDVRVVYLPPRTNHVLHLLITLLTGGLWIPVWVLVSINNARNGSGPVTDTDRRRNLRFVAIVTIVAVSVFDVILLPGAIARGTPLGVAILAMILVGMGVWAWWLFVRRVH